MNTEPNQPPPGVIVPKGMKYTRTEMMGGYPQHCFIEDKPDPQPAPLDRPDKPGWWWEWRDDAGEWLAVLIVEQKGQLLYATDDGMLFPTEDGKWLPATPPPAPKEEGEPQPVPQCAWTLDDGNGLADTSCGKHLSFEEEPNVEDLAFCPGCGRRVNIKTPAPSEEGVG